MITVGFTLIGRAAWSGGDSYQRNMFAALRDLLRDKISVKLFLSPDQARSVGGRFDEFTSAPAIVDDRVNGAGEGRRAIEAIAFGSDRRFAALVAAHRVDVMFESAQWFGNRFPASVISWIPDLQHRKLPHLFPRRTWWKRDIGYRVQTAGRRLVMLSSEDARMDSETFYPASRGKTAVVRFAVDLDPVVCHERSESIRKAYGLPERFFFLPNQFWTHKNHSLVVDALIALKERRVLDGVPPVILTGRAEDARDPGLFSRLFERASAAGVASHFRHLGLIPLDDVYALNACADRLINPSFVEGWSTTVEEAKALGTPMLLSDIRLHREQAPHADFFDPASPGSLADAMRLVAESEPRPPPDPDALRVAQAKRRRDYADALLAAFRRAQSQ